MAWYRWSRLENNPMESPRVPPKSRLGLQMGQLTITEENQRPNSFQDNRPTLSITTPAATKSDPSNSRYAFGDAAQSSPIEAEKSLSLFNTYKATKFPFVFIPATTTAQQLRQENPFLWLCIMAVASRSTAQQQVLGKRVRKTLAQEMLLQSGQSIDLFLRILAYAAWDHSPKL